MICSRALRWLNVCSVVYTLSLSKALSQKEIGEQAHDSNRAGTESRGAWQQGNPWPCCSFHGQSLAPSLPRALPLCPLVLAKTSGGVFIVQRLQRAMETTGSGCTRPSSTAPPPHSNIRFHYAAGGLGGKLKTRTLKAPSLQKK